MILSQKGWKILLLGAPSSSHTRSQPGIQTPPQPPLPRCRLPETPTKVSDHPQLEASNPWPTSWTGIVDLATCCSISLDLQSSRLSLSGLFENSHFNFILRIMLKSMFSKRPFGKSFSQAQQLYCSQSSVLGAVLVFPVETTTRSRHSQPWAKSSGNNVRQASHCTPSPHANLCQPMPNPANHAMPMTIVSDHWHKHH